MNKKNETLWKKILDLLILIKNLEENLDGDSS